MHVSLEVLAFATILSIAVASLASLGPMRAAVQGAVIGALTGVARGSVGSRRHRPRILVICQVALAMTVMAGSGVLIRSWWQLQAVRVELASEQLFYIPLDLPHARYSDRAVRERFMATLTGELRALPVIRAATAINVGPFSGDGWDAPTFTAEGQSPENAQDNPTLNLEEVGPGYFETFVVPLIEGRVFTVDDRSDTTNVAIISLDVARHLSGSGSVIGRRIKMGAADSPDVWRTVVGVVAPTRYREIREARATLYLPATQMIGTAQNLAVRTAAPLSVVTAVVRQAAMALDPTVRIMPPQSFDARLDARLARPRLTTMLVTLFGALSLALATVGVYAVVAGSVRQRTREIGIRLATGATAASIRVLVLKEGLSLTGIGLLLGLATSVLSTRLLQQLLFEVSPLDPQSLAVCGGIVLIICMLALHFPARQASRIDPATLLR